MKINCFVTWIFLACALTACGVGTTPTLEPLATVPAEFAGRANPYGPASAQQGAEIYKTYCESCHGESGRGDGVAGGSLVPPPKNLVELQSTVQDDYLFWRIHNGKSGTAMVAWKGILTDEQIWQVVSFIRTLK